MKKFVLTAILLSVGVLLFYALTHKHSNPWVIRSYQPFGSNAEGRYAWEYRGDPVLEVIDPAGRDLFLCGFTIEGKDHFCITAGTNRLVDLALNGYWFQGTVEGQKTQLRPGAKIVLRPNNSIQPTAGRKAASGG